MNGLGLGCDNYAASRSQHARRLSVARGQTRRRHVQMPAQPPQTPAWTRQSAKVHSLCNAKGYLASQGILQCAKHGRQRQSRTHKHQTRSSLRPTTPIRSPRPPKTLGGDAASASQLFNRQSMSASTNRPNSRGCIRRRRMWARRKRKKTPQTWFRSHTVHLEKGDRGRPGAETRPVRKRDVGEGGKGQLQAPRS